MRVLVFTDVNSPVSAALVLELIRLSRVRVGMDVCGIVTSEAGRFDGGRGRDVLRIGRRALVNATNSGVQARLRTPRLNLPRVARAAGIPVLVPAHGDPNDPEFIDLLDEQIRPNVALSLFCLSIFGPALLARFEASVNFHDALLPRHKGLLATSFALYARDENVGLTFHHMTPDVDGGPILVQRSLTVTQRDTLESVRRRQRLEASAALPQVLDLMRDRDPGIPQRGVGSYHSRRDALAITHIEQPSDLTLAELANRLRAFGVLHIRLGGREYPVTRLRSDRSARRGARAEAAAGSLTFATADGAALSVDRLAGLPVALFRIAQPLYSI